MMKIGQQLEAPKLPQKTLETPGILPKFDRKVVTMDWLMFGFGSVRFNNWAIKSDATTKSMGFWFVLDPGSPKEGPGLWRRWGRSVFKRFPHRLTKLWNTMVWSHCFWLETHKKPGKRMGNTLQWLNWKTSVFWTFNCQQTGEPPSEEFWGFLFCESFSIPGEDRQGVETGDPKDLSVPRQGDQPSNNLIGFPPCSLRANELLEKWRNLGFANDLD